MVPFYSGYTAAAAALDNKTIEYRKQQYENFVAKQLHHS